MAASANKESKHIPSVTKMIKPNTLKKKWYETTLDSTFFFLPMKVHFWLIVVDKSELVKHQMS